MLHLRVLHGSRLYGWAREDSDWDFIEVHDTLPKNKRASQRIANGFDVKKYSLSHFLLRANVGDPAILETMFAPDRFVAHSSPLMDEFRRGFWVNPASAFESYNGVKNSVLSMNSAKGLRNYFRLAHDYDRLLEYGYFDPTEYGVHLSRRGI